MPSTERSIIGSVDGDFNQIDVKPCFRYSAHKMIKIAVRIEIRVFLRIIPILKHSVFVCMCYHCKHE